jgi:hypothetical protein
MEHATVLSDKRGMKAVSEVMLISLTHYALNPSYWVVIMLGVGQELPVRRSITQAAKTFILLYTKKGQQIAQWALFCRIWSNGRRYNRRPCRRGGITPNLGVTSFLHQTMRIIFNGIEVCQRFISPKTGVSLFLRQDLQLDMIPLWASTKQATVFKIRSNSGL